jgi:hypothetical protein
MPNTKVVENIQIYLHAKFHIFPRSLSISPILFSHVDLFNWKRNLKSEKGRGPFSPRQPNSAPTMGHSRARSQPNPVSAPQPLTAGTHPSTLSLPPIPLLYSAHVATPAKLPPMSRPPITTFAPQRSHLCARTLEPSHRSLMSCGVKLALPLLALPPSLHQPGIPC